MMAPQKFDRAENEALLHRYFLTKDQNIRDQLVLTNRGLVSKCLRRFQDQGEPLADLQQVGNIGLIKAIERFDSNHQVKFATYACRIIQGEIQHHLRDCCWRQKVPRSLKESVFSLHRIIKDLTQKLGRQPTDQEILCEFGGISVERLRDIYQAEEASRVPISLEEIELIERIGDTDDHLLYLIEAENISWALDKLDKRSREIIILIFFQNFTLKAVAIKMQMSKMNVSKIQQRALTRLKELLKNSP